MSKDKETKLTPGSNKIFSSSFILPEHREAIWNRYKVNKKRTKPISDEQHWERIEYLLSEAMSKSEDVTVTIWNDYKDEQIKGTIVKYDDQLKRIKVINNTEVSWIKVNDILDIDL